MDNISDYVYTTQSTMTEATMNVQCPVPGCTYSTGEQPSNVAAALLTAHTTTHTSGTRRRGPKVDRPPLRDNLDEVGWNTFLQNWQMFVRANDVEGADQPTQLMWCCDASLKSKVTAICPDVDTKPIAEVLATLKKIADIPVAVTVKRIELLQMTQDAEEKVRSFHSRIQGKAMTCGFKIKCHHTHATNAAFLVITRRK